MQQRGAVYSSTCRTRRDGKGKTTKSCRCNLHTAECWCCCCRNNSLRHAEFQIITAMASVQSVVLIFKRGDSKRRRIRRHSSNYVSNGDSRTGWWWFKNRNEPGRRIERGSTMHESIAAAALSWLGLSSSATGTSQRRRCDRVTADWINDDKSSHQFTQQMERNF